MWWSSIKCHGDSSKRAGPFLPKSLPESLPKSFSSRESKRLMIPLYTALSTRLAPSRIVEWYTKSRTASGSFVSLSSHPPALVHSFTDLAILVSVELIRYWEKTHRQYHLSSFSKPLAEALNLGEDRINAIGGIMSTNGTKRRPRHPYRSTNTFSASSNAPTAASQCSLIWAGFKPNMSPRLQTPAG